MNLTDTVEFKRWFGASKVVNPDGTPKVVYHGTTAEKPFTVFRRSTDPERINVGFHFGTPEQAVYRVTGLEQTSPGYAETLKQLKASGRIFSVYLSLQSPVTLDDQFAWDASGTAAALKERRRRGFTQKLVNHLADMEDQGHKEAAINLFISKCQEVGIDGFIYENEIEGAGESYLALYPWQIKSVHNRGTFSRTNPDMLQGAFSGLLAGGRRPYSIHRKRYVK